MGDRGDCAGAVSHCDGHLCCSCSPPARVGPVEDKDPQVAGRNFVLSRWLVEPSQGRSDPLRDRRMEKCACGRAKRSCCCCLLVQVRHDPIRTSFPNAGRDAISPDQAVCASPLSSRRASPIESIHENRAVRKFDHQAWLERCRIVAPPRQLYRRNCARRCQRHSSRLAWGGGRESASGNVSDFVGDANEPSRRRVDVSCQRNAIENAPAKPTWSATSCGF